MQCAIFICKIITLLLYINNFIEVYKTDKIKFVISFFEILTFIS